MKIIKKTIGYVNNRKIISITLINNNNFQITFFNYGGYIHKILIPKLKDQNQHEDVILGYNKFKNIEKESSYFNCIIGRVGNRISNSKFKLNNKTYKLSNNDGKNHLHGGVKGFNKKIWNIKKIFKSQNKLSCEFEYLSKDLEEGYPGNVLIKSKYSLNNKNEFSINYIAKSDADTLINITNHNYWNFHGHGKFYQNIKNHSVKIYSQKVCENDKESIPTGNLIDIKNTKYDFSHHTKISSDLLKKGGIDNNYDIGKKKIVKKVAEVFSNLSKMGAIYYTDQPGLQFYTGNMMLKNYNGKENKQYGLHYGFCLEPQFFPNAINIKNFKKPIFKKGEKYTSNIIIKLLNNFTVD